MLLAVTGGALVVRFGKRFGSSEAERVVEAIVNLGPISKVSFDFAEVRRFEPTAIIPLSLALRGARDLAIGLKGLTHHQLRMFQYFGVNEPNEQHFGASSSHMADESSR